jgi:hypothetical protein
MHVDGSLSLTEAVAIVVPEGADVPLHPAIIAATAPSATRARNNSSRETQKFFTRKDLLQFSVFMSAMAFHSKGERGVQALKPWLDPLVVRCLKFNGLEYHAQHCNTFRNSGNSSTLYPLPDQEIAEIKMSQNFAPAKRITP